MDTGVVTDVPRHYVRPDVTGRTSGRTSGPTADERAAALPRSADDVALVDELTGWSLPGWRGASAQ